MMCPVCSPGLVGAVGCWPLTPFSVLGWNNSSVCQAVPQNKFSTPPPGVWCLQCTLATQPPPADLQPNQQLDLQLVASALAAETNMIAAAATNKDVQDASDLMEALEIMTGTQTVAV